MVRLPCRIVACLAYYDSMADSALRQPEARHNKHDESQDSRLQIFRPNLGNRDRQVEDISAASRRPNTSSALPFAFIFKISLKVVTPFLSKSII